MSTLVDFHSNGFNNQVGFTQAESPFCQPAYQVTNMRQQYSYPPNNQMFQQKAGQPSQLVQDGPNGPQMTSYDTLSPTAIQNTQNNLLNFGNQPLTSSDENRHRGSFEEQFFSAPAQTKGQNFAVQSQKSGPQSQNFNVQNAGQYGTSLGSQTFNGQSNMSCPVQSPMSSLSISPEQIHPGSRPHSLNVFGNHNNGGLTNGNLSNHNNGRLSNGNHSNGGLINGNHNNGGLTNGNHSNGGLINGNYSTHNNRGLTTKQMVLDMIDNVLPASDFSNFQGPSTSSYKPVMNSNHYDITNNHLSFTVPATSPITDFPTSADNFLQSYNPKPISSNNLAPQNGFKVPQNPPNQSNLIPVKQEPFRPSFSDMTSQPGNYMPNRSSNMNMLLQNNYNQSSMNSVASQSAMTSHPGMTSQTGMVSHSGMTSQIGMASHSGMTSQTAMVASHSGMTSQNGMTSQTAMVPRATRAVAGFPYHRTYPDYSPSTSS